MSSLPSKTIRRITKIVSREEIIKVIPADLPALADGGWGDAVHAIKVMKSELERTCLMAKWEDGRHLTECTGKVFTSEGTIRFCPFCGGVAKIIVVLEDE